MDEKGLKYIHVPVCFISLCRIFKVFTFAPVMQMSDTLNIKCNEIMFFARNKCCIALECFRNTHTAMLYRFVTVSLVQ